MNLYWVWEPDSSWLNLKKRMPATHLIIWCRPAQAFLKRITLCNLHCTNHIRIIASGFSTVVRIPDDSMPALICILYEQSQIKRAWDQVVWSIYEVADTQHHFEHSRLCGSKSYLMLPDNFPALLKNIASARIQQGCLTKTLLTTKTMTINSIGHLSLDLSVAHFFQIPAA